uniref:SWIM-type domain-containing protein n=1 Tax=Kalanchoe fedtschenkoi TaxID=63787 RepID=A0A7N0U5Y5_KALFE
MESSSGSSLIFCDRNNIHALDGGANHNQKSVQDDSVFEIDDQNDECEFKWAAEDNIFLSNTREGGTLILGRLFASKDEAYDFYNHYALNHGFGIRVNGHTKSRTIKEIIRWQFVCNKEGFKSKDKRQMGKDVKSHRGTRTGCKAKMEIALRNDEWVVDKFEDEHNHIPTTPSKVMKHRSHNKFHRTPIVRNLVYELNQKGLKPAAITKVVNAMSGSHKGDITSKQCTDLLRKEKKNHVGRECYGIIKHFHEKTKSDGSHYFAMDLAPDGSLRSVFWADGRSRSAYAQFGDVLVFDVTYRTNHFKLPFAPLVGVNHHRQSILFGAALLEDETEETFAWLFEQFLKCMFEKPPLTIITDQDGAMKKAIKRIFPHTRHRFCAWHINKHVIEHLHSFCVRFDDFEETYTKWQKRNTIEEFELDWEIIKQKYSIGKGSWLENMYNQRYYWVKVYLNDCFTAGMTTSGRSESMNSYFDGYVNSNTMLNDFVKQYDKAVEARRIKEEEEDFYSMESHAVLLTSYPIGKALPNLPSNGLDCSSYIVHSLSMQSTPFAKKKTSYPIEEQVARLYTRNLFEIFKLEWRKSFDCIHQKSNKGINFVEYLVGKHGVDVKHWRTVNYESCGELSVKCACCKFEMEGILCKHILYIVRKKYLEVIPDRYFLPRWTITARYKDNNMVKNSSTRYEQDEIVAPPLTLWSIQRKFNTALEVSRKSPSDLQLLESLLDSYIDNVGNKKLIDNVGEDVETQNNPNTPLVFVNDQCLMTIRDPASLAKNKGRPPLSTRFESGLELAAKAKRQKTCRTCQKKGHNSSSCAMRKHPTMVDMRLGVAKQRLMREVV